MRSFAEWMSLVEEMVYLAAGINLRSLPNSHPYQQWWETGCSPKWAARQSLSMDNG